MRCHTRRVVTAAGVAALFLLSSGSIGRLSQRLFAQAAPGEIIAPGPIIVDPPGPYVGRSYVPAPTSNLVAPQATLSTFIVTYNGFTPQAQAAFQAAVDVWSTIVQSSVPIRVTATWEPLPQNVLGSAGARTIHANFPGAPVANTWYPQAVANRLSGTDRSVSNDDIVASFSSVFTWYYGTDGNAGANYDLMSVVMHELGHGLGFFGSMDGESPTAGFWGAQGLPFIYDRFAVNGSSQFLLDTTLFPLNSPALSAQLTSDNLFFIGAGALAGNGGAGARLYAPATWNGGSSYSHLREATFTPGNANSLMTPQLGAGEAIHNPGPITKGMFADMGWNSAALSTTPGSLTFGAVKNGAAGNLVSTTPTQPVTVTFAGTSAAWTASTTSTWLRIANGSGTGAGQFSVSIVNPGNVINSSTVLNGSITISAPGLGATTAVAVRLNVQQTPGTTSAPYGAFDSPAQNATNVSGAIGVTGWSLDDIGVANVQIWRNCVETIDRPLGACTAPAPGQLANFVFIANAAFLSGARPDVEQVSQGVPQNYRAGWGYLMSTNALPHLGNNLPAGGQGGFTLSAYAVDVEGNFALLGTKSITLNNDGATIPFGALDTPAQGGLVTTTPFPSFGWAMTQNPKCIDSTTTASFRVYIDGISRPLTAGANFISGLTRSDIAAAYPLRCDTNDALAAYYIDVNALGLANGLHTTGWDVFDSGANAAGIGSRFFNILIGSALTTGAPADDRPVALGSSGGLAWLAPDRGPISFQIGGDEAPFQTSEPSSSGEHTVQFPSGGRLAIDLGGPVTAGFQVVGDELRELPGGSTLLADDGFFAWQPAVPFLGPFHLVFVRDHLRIDVRARIIDAIADAPLEMHIDLPSSDSSVGGSFIVAGWALDPLAVSGSGIDTLHVWAYRRDAVAVPQFLGAAAVGGWRPDIAALKGEQFGRTGFSLTTSSLAPGVYDILVYPWSHRLGAFQEAQSVRVVVR